MVDVLYLQLQNPMIHTALTEHSATEKVKRKKDFVGASTYYYSSEEGNNSFTAVDVISAKSSIPTIERFTLNSMTIGSVKFLIAVGWPDTTVAPSTLEPIILNLVELVFSYCVSGNITAVE